MLRTTGFSTAQKDAEVPDGPPDSISSLSFSPQADFLAVGSWDNNVRIYEVNADAPEQSKGRAMYGHQGPVLSVCWNKEGSKVFSGGADSAGRMLDLTSGQSQQVAQHDAPVKTVRWIESPQGSYLVTGSWDKTLRYWDLRSSNPIATVQLAERCYSLDTNYPLMVVGTADRNMQIFNLTQPTVPFRTVKSPLKWQTRVVTCFPDGTGYAAGSVEGRAAMQYLEDTDGTRSYTFRCNRRDAMANMKDQSIIFAVNDINFHPIHGTFSTCGSDGVFAFWDKDARSRLQVCDIASGPITASCFNRTGTIFAYAISYDWYKGHSGMTPNHPNKIMLHACKDDEVRRRVAKPR